MSDITKCMNGCRIQLLCKRYTSPAHPTYQSWAEFKTDAGNSSCCYFWPNTVATVKEKPTEVSKVERFIGEGR